MGPELQRRCLGCGYRLDFLDEPRCPECGRAFDPADPRSFAGKHALTGPARDRLTILWAMTTVGGLVPISGCVLSQALEVSLRWAPEAKSFLAAVWTCSPVLLILVVIGVSTARADHSLHESFKTVRNCAAGLLIAYVSFGVLLYGCLAGVMGPC